MSKLISFTSGSKFILTKIMRKYPEHQLYLYKSITENNFKLIDWFTNKVIFKSPISYHLLQSSKHLKKGPFINLIFLTLSLKQLKVLLACINNQLATTLPSKMTSLFLLKKDTNPSNIIIGSSWESNTDYLKWVKNSFITKFINESNNSSFHNNLIIMR